MPLGEPTIIGLPSIHQNGQFAPQIEVTRRQDNGHYVATGHGESVTHHDQAEAVNRLSDKLQALFIAGTLTLTD